MVLLEYGDGDSLMEHWMKSLGGKMCVNKESNILVHGIEQSPCGGAAVGERFAGKLGVRPDPCGGSVELENALTKDFLPTHMALGVYTILH